MPPRDWRIRVKDIFDCMDKIDRYVRGMDLEAFVKDDKTVDAVVRNLITIGEAAGQLPAEITARYPEVPWDDIKGMRNIVVHVYFGVSLKIIWQTTLKNLPEFRAQLERILEENK
jgi:uncharacterized protein with HEPN domain